MVHPLGKEYELLNKFVGTWQTKGKVLASKQSPEIVIKGTDSYEWLPGEYFLIHKADVMMGKKRNQTLEVIGYDAQKQAFFMQHFDNQGNSGLMFATCKEDTWEFAGEFLKFVGGFKKDDQEFSGQWLQRSNDQWIYFMDIKLTK